MNRPRNWAIISTIHTGIDENKVVAGHVEVLVVMPTCTEHLHCDLDQEGDP